MKLIEAYAILKAINRWCRKNLKPGWDYATWAAVYPRMAAVFNEAAAEVKGRPGRYLPLFRA